MGTYVQEGMPMTYVQEGMPMTYVQEGMPMTMPTVMYAAAPQPMVYNISPEMFQRIAAGGALTQEELDGLMGGSTVAAQTMAVPAGTTVATATSSKRPRRPRRRSRCRRRRRAALAAERLVAVAAVTYVQEPMPVTYVQEG